MAITLPDARQLSDDVLEALRLRALRGRELGFTEADVANLLGVSRETVCRWWSAYTAHGTRRAAARADRTPPRLGPTPLRRAGQPASKDSWTTTAPKTWASPPRCGTAAPCAT